jgi:tRNA threonylcarbamoyladenosine biosynthesis protein TsaB
VTILAIDTTSNVASVAIRAHHRTVAALSLESSTGFGHLIFDAIEKCRNEARIDLADVDCFAAAAGPGSFTGLRVGLSAVKGLAEALGKPVAGISNLRALSSFGKNSDSLRAVVLDARRSEVYAAVYDAEHQLRLPETVSPLAEWLARLDPAGQYEFISRVPLGLAGTPFRDMPVIEPPDTLAEAVALCAEQDGPAGRWVDPAALDANYVRRSDAELFWKDA